jgi:long-subunit acyl-CoA synthetase (AMP-forming)
VVNSLLTPTEVSSILRKSRPAAIITSAPHAIAEAVKLIGDRELAQRYERFVLTLDPQDIDFDKTVGEDDHRILLKAASASHRYRIQPMSENETKRRVAAIYWSSGTGGQSKGVLQSHYSLVAGICNSWHGNRWQGADQVRCMPGLRCLG